MLETGSARRRRIDLPWPEQITLPEQLRRGPAPQLEMTGEQPVQHQEPQPARIDLKVRDVPVTPLKVGDTSDTVDHSPISITGRHGVQQVLVLAQDLACLHTGT